MFIPALSSLFTTLGYYPDSNSDSQAARSNTENVFVPTSPYHSEPSASGLKGGARMWKDAQEIYQTTTTQTLVEPYSRTPEASHADALKFVHKALEMLGTNCDTPSMKGYSSYILTPGEARAISSVDVPVSAMFGRMELEPDKSGKTISVNSFATRILDLEGYKEALSTWLLVDVIATPASHIILENDPTHRPFIQVVNILGLKEMNFALALVDAGGMQDKCGKYYRVFYWYALDKETEALANDWIRTVENMGFWALELGSNDLTQVEAISYGLLSYTDMTDVEATGGVTQTALEYAADHDADSVIESTLHKMVNWAKELEKPKK